MGVAMLREASLIATLLFLSMEKRMQIDLAYKELVRHKRDLHQIRELVNR